MSEHDLPWAEFPKMIQAIIREPVPEAVTINWPEEGVEAQPRGPCFRCGQRDALPGQALCEDCMKHWAVCRELIVSGRRWREDWEKIKSRVECNEGKLLSEFPFERITAMMLDFAHKWEGKVKGCGNCPACNVAAGKCPHGWSEKRLCPDCEPRML